eukprot:GILK01002668.1.p1 GENE.GILK01002668.1~~GILK01002668.1.p1  ORF type:complete len:536 (+),score=83.59 GILK01002668.1:68-1675(+)
MSGPSTTPGHMSTPYQTPIKHGGAMYSMQPYPGSTPQPVGRPPLSSYSTPMAGARSSTPGTSYPPMTTPSSSYAATPYSGKKRGRIPNAVKSAQQEEAMGRLKKRKLGERVLPEKVMALVPEAQVYGSLLEFEKKLDSAITRKKLDIQETLKKPAPKLKKILRMHIYNVHVNQKADDPELGTYQPQDWRRADAASWGLRIQGKLLEDDPSRLPGYPSTPGLNPVPRSSGPGKKFSSFFRKVFIFLDKRYYPRNDCIEWDKSISQRETDGFEIKRTGDKEFDARIVLYLDYAPNQYKLTPLLASILGFQQETRPRILTALWEYIKANKLQDPDNRKIINNNAELRQIFNCDRMEFGSLLSRLREHLDAPDPIEIIHRIRLTGDWRDSEAVYDVAIDVDDPLPYELSQIVSRPNSLLYSGASSATDPSASQVGGPPAPVSQITKDINVLDDQIMDLIQKMNEHKHKREFMLQFSKSPVDFINFFMASQMKDLKALKSDQPWTPDEERLSAFYQQPWAPDAVKRYLDSMRTGPRPVGK